GDGFGLYRFNADQPQVRPVVDVVPLRREYERIAAQTKQEARAEYEKRHSHWNADAVNRAGRTTSIEDIIKALDNRGAWLGNCRVLTVVPRSEGINPGTFEIIRGYSTSTFVRNMRALIDYVTTTKGTD
ncbi:MAG TPA: hypothetical protein VIJ87_00170, partial [Pyrinomonadaceae bacterium]